MSNLNMSDFSIFRSFEHGADIHAENDDALRYASAHGHLEIVNYLTEL
jgi:hypothetical protein